MKKYNVKRSTALFATCVLLVLAGCKENTAQSNVTTQLKEAIPVVSFSKTAKPQGKPRLPVALAIPQQRIEPGSPYLLDLSLLTDLHEGTLDITIELPDSLTHISGKLEQVVDMSEDQPKINIGVLASAQEKHYVKLRLRYNHEQAEAGRVLSAIVWSGAPEALKKQAASQKADAPNTVNLPAEETLRSAQ